MNNKSKSENLSDLNKNEKSLLSAWKNEASNSLEALAAMHDIEKHAGQMKDYKEYDAAKAFEKITGEKYEQNNIRFLPTFKKIAIAASLLIVVGYGILNYWTNSTNLEYTSSDTSKELLLPDQSSVTLDKQSKLRCINDRQVRLNGSAFFHVETTPDKKNFTIQVGEGIITVLGTKFYVAFSEGQTTIKVVEGKVKYANGLNEVILINGDNLDVSKENKMVVNKFNQPTAPKILEFKNKPLIEAIKEINAHFGVNIVLNKNEKIKSNCLITSKFSTETVEQLMKELQVLFKISYVKKDGQYFITSIEC